MSWLTIVGRLRPGQTLDSATVSLRGLQPQIREATLPATASAPLRKTYLQAGFALIPAATGNSGLRRQYRQPLIAIMVVVALVMLVACANIANLLLARATARRHEFSVRLALGASRWRLARQVLAESAVLAASGTALGVLIASWGSRALVRELARQTDTQSTTVFLDLSLNWHVLVFTIGAAVGTVMLFGIAPAFRASGVTPMDTMKEGRGTIGDARARLSSSLVVAQLTLSVVLVVAAGLFVRTFASLASLPLGFEPDRVLVVTVSAQRATVDAAQRIPIFERAVNAVQSLPNVASAAASLTTPVSGVGLQNQIEVSGAVRLAENERGIFVNHVSPEWFRTFGTPVLAGREFSSVDGPGKPSVAIVNEAFGRRFLERRQCSWPCHQRPAGIRSGSSHRRCGQRRRLQRASRTRPSDGVPAVRAVQRGDRLRIDEPEHSIERRFAGGVDSKRDGRTQRSESGSDVDVPSAGRSD